MPGTGVVLGTGILDSMSDRMRRVNEAAGRCSPKPCRSQGPTDRVLTVTGVETSHDLRHARVFISVLGTQRKQAASLEGLAADHGVLQARVARELRMKRTPLLAFEYDRTVEEGVRMSKLIDDLAR